MPFILFACFMLFCGPRPHAVQHHGPTYSCANIVLAYTQKTSSRDEFVRAFPASRQHHVLECIGDAQ